MNVYSCPHCERTFHASPDVLGKTIRCRGCRNPFCLPNDAPPLAIACEIDGVDARSCPECGRTFAMKADFADKTIRCRGCRSSFRVAATERPALEPAGVGGGLFDAEPPCRIEPMARPASPLAEAARPGVAPRRQPQEGPHSKSVLKPFLAVIAAGLCLVFVLDRVLDLGPPDVPPLGDHEVPHPPAPLVVDAPQVQPPVVAAPPIVLPAAPPVPEPPVPEPVITPDNPPARPIMRNLDEPSVEPLIRDAYGAIQREDFAAADRALAEGERLAARHLDANTRVRRWQLFAEYARKYVKLREDAFKAANQGREYEVDGEPFAVIEITPTEFIYLHKNRDRRRVPRAAVDPRIEMAIVGTWLRADGRPANHIYLGTRWLCFRPHAPERCRAEWQTAANRGAPVEQLLPLLDDPVILRK